MVNGKVEKKEETWYHIMANELLAIKISGHVTSGVEWRSSSRRKRGEKKKEERKGKRGEEEDTGPQGEASAE